MANAEPRRYRTAPGFWGFGFTHSSSGHVAFQFGPWVFTTEPEGGSVRKSPSYSGYGDNATFGKEKP